MITKLTFASLLLATTAFVAQAAGPASDNASDPVYQLAAGGWTAGDNGGTGFQPWSFVAQNFIGSSVNNGAAPSGGIDTNGVSFGLFSNTGAPGFAQAVRPFSSGLAIGETFIMDFDNGFVGASGQVGFALRSGGISLFQFTFSGGTNFYLVDAGTAQQTSHGFTDAGMRATFTLTSANTFNFSIKFNDNQTLETFSGTLAGSGVIDNLRIFASNPNEGSGASSDVYFNNMAVIPEPSSLSLLAGPAMLGAWFFVRRRRA